MRTQRGIALPLVLILMTVVLVTAVYLLNTTTMEMKFSFMNRRIKTASALANNVVTDLLRQFSQSYQEDHYDMANLARSPAFYSQGFSSVTISPNALQHFVSFEAVGSYGSDLNNPMNKKTIDGVIKFVSDLTTFGTMSNGNFTTSAGNVTYGGKVWINGNWTVSGNNIAVQGGPVFVNGNITASGVGDLTVNGDLYHTGTLSGPITVTGANNNYVPQMTWPTIDHTYFDTYSNVKVTANTTVRFYYDGVSSTGSVRVGTTTYAIPSTGFIIYGENCTLTSSGTVKGHVTLASVRTSGSVGGDIKLDSDLQYATAGSTSLASASDSFAAVASNSIQWNRSVNKDLHISGVYFVDSPGTSGMSTTCTGCTNKTFHFFGTRNKGISTSGWTNSAISFDTNLDTYPPPGLPERPNLVTYRVK